MTFIICQPQDSLSDQVDHGEAYLLSYHSHPKHALKFDSFDEAKQIAQRICDHKEISTFDL